MTGIMQLLKNTDRALEEDIAGALEEDMARLEHVNDKVASLPASVPLPPVSLVELNHEAINRVLASLNKRHDQISTLIAELQHHLDEVQVSINAMTAAQKELGAKTVLVKPSEPLKAS